MLTVTQAAKLMNVHRNTILSWLQTGQLAGSKPGGRYWRIDPAALDAMTGKDAAGNAPAGHTLQPHYVVDDVILTARMHLAEPTTVSAAKLAQAVEKLATATKFDERASEER